MRDLPSETFVTGFFSNELANTVGVPFNITEKHMPFFCARILKCSSRKCIISLVGWYLLWRLFSLLAMLIVAKKLIDPITELTAATKKVGEEQFSGTLDINRRDEIGQLAKSFQQMTREVE